MVYVPRECIAFKLARILPIQIEQRTSTPEFESPIHASKLKQSLLIHNQELNLLLDRIHDRVADSVERQDHG